MSYASEDAEAAERLCGGLRAAGIEIWFDQSELRGGDVWDQKIRRQIHECALFMPVISANTASRHEGYFRLEWDLADQRTHMMARDRTFIVPVCLDATPGAGTDVPESFHRVQWTRLPAGETSTAFAERVRRLLSSAQDPARTAHPATPALSDAVVRARPPLRGPSWSKPGLWGTVAVLAVLAYFVADKFWISRHRASPPTPPPAPISTAPIAFTPPPHSIAVLPFVNMSGDKDQEYFSDGLTEEILNSLARIGELQVSARTSSFSFKGKDTDLATIARKLNVGSVLEGSVRRSEHTIRVTAQLNNAVTGFHLWSQTYDRSLNDVLKLQTEIATAVADALKVTLLGHVAARTELGGTRSPAAFDAYLRGMSAFRTYHNDQDLLTAIADYTDAIRLDPDYALAHAGRAMATRQHLDEFGTPQGAEAVRTDARRAIALAPDLAEGHLALAYYLDTFQQDLTLASVEYERAAALAPGNAQVTRDYGMALAMIGRTESSIATARSAVALDPLNAVARRLLGRTLLYARRYDEAIAALNEASRLDPGDPWAAGMRGLSYYLLGDAERARASCEVESPHYEIRVCRAIVYRRLGRPADAEAQFEALRATSGDSVAYQNVQIYSQWGDKDKALEWLETAMRVRDTGLKNMKADPLLDPVRGEPRFQAVMRKLKFP